MARDTGYDVLSGAAADLAKGLVRQFEPDSILGYRDLDPEGVPVERAALLEGAAGVVLALLAAASPVAPDWYRTLLLS